MIAARNSLARSGPAARPAQVVAEAPAAASEGGSSFVIEALGEVDAGRHRDAWKDLQARCLEDNVFLDPDFALPAARHLGGERGPDFILVWARETGGRRALVAVCPVSRSRNPFRRIVPVWYHDFAALGVPLLDATRGEAALRAILGWIRHGLPRCHALLFRAVPTDGPTAALLRKIADGSGSGHVVLATWDRAVLRRDGDPRRSGYDALSAKKAKELRRQRRRLSSLGDESYTSARAGDDLTAAAERFMALEAGGWKGAAGTALLSRPALAAFFRTMTGLLGQDGRCRIDTLAVDGVPIAMGVVLSAGATDFFWKTAYAEDLARLSPGVQFVLRFGEVQVRDGRAALTDSCAMPHHPMIDRLWRDRLGLSDIAIATGPRRSTGFRLAIAKERATRRLRALAKSGVVAWRRRRNAKAAP